MKLLTAIQNSSQSSPNAASVQASPIMAPFAKSVTFRSFRISPLYLIPSF